ADLILRVDDELEASGGKRVIADATKVNDYVAFVIPNIAAGGYSVRIGMQKRESQGVIQTVVSRQMTGAFEDNLGEPIDQYQASTVCPAVRNLYSTIPPMPKSTLTAKVSNRHARRPVGKRPLSLSKACSAALAASALWSAPVLNAGTFYWTGDNGSLWSQSA